MKIELRNFKPAHSQSQETLAFHAAIHADGVRVGHVSNEGTGGSCRIIYSDRETAQRVRAFIEALPPNPLFPSLAMDEDQFFSGLASDLVAAADEKKNRKRHSDFAIKAHSRGLSAFCIAVALDGLSSGQPGADATILVESKDMPTTERAQAIAAKHGAQVVSITQLRPPGELTLDEAHGVMTMKRVLGAKNGVDRFSIARDASIDWLLERGFIKLGSTNAAARAFGFNGADALPYATKVGREWFHSTPGAGVAMLVISKARKAS